MTSALFDEIGAHLGPGKTLYTRARGTKFRAYVSADHLIVESERSGRKAFSRVVVEEAAKAISESAPAVADRAVQVARSWVGAIQDSMRGAPNAPRRGSAASTGRTPARPSPRRKAAKNTTKASRAGTRPRGRSATRRARASGRVATPVAAPRVDPAEFARQIGREIARAIADGRQPQAEQIEASVMAQIRDQIAATNDALERARVDLAEATKRAETAEREAAVWRGSAVAVPAIGMVAIVAEQRNVDGQEPIAQLLRDASKSWRSAPSGSIAASRSALERVVRAVAGRLPGGDRYVDAPFADVHRFLASNVGAPNNLLDPDVHLARDLYRRSSKAGHGEAGWTPSVSEAVLILVGTATIAHRAKLV